MQLKTGLRTGEIAGLTWDCVLWEQQAIKTYRRYDTVRRRWTKPKTEESARKVPIDLKVIKVLDDLHAIQKGYLDLYHITNDDNVIFLDLFYGIQSNNGVNKRLRSILKELDIAPKNMSSTGLRHSYCSLLLAKGVDIWAVAKLMGHKDIQMLIKVYGHTMTERIDKEFKEVESIMDRL